MACKQRGMALVSVVVMLSVLLTLGHILCEKVWQSTRQSAVAASREQLFWAAQAGLETARRELAANYASSDGWRSLLLSSRENAYPAAAAWQTGINGVPVEIYLRDNPDGDGSLRIDNDLKLFVLVRARGRQGAEVMLESLCGFGTASGRRAEEGRGSAGELANQSLTRYGIDD